MASSHLTDRRLGTLLWVGGDMPGATTIVSMYNLGSLKTRSTEFSAAILTNSKNTTFNRCNLICSKCPEEDVVCQGVGWGLGKLPVSTGTGPWARMPAGQGGQGSAHLTPGDVHEHCTAG
jgi:hypothetical protein